MPTAKARYLGDGTGSQPRDFSDRLRATLRKFYPDQKAVDDPVWGHPGDNFVEEILAETRWATAELHWHTFTLTRQEIRAEHADLLKTLTTTRDKLRSLSTDLDRLLGVTADPLGCADAMTVLIEKVEAAEPLIDRLPSKAKAADAQHDVAVELAIRVLPILERYGCSTGATGSAYYDHSSDAVQILKAIGDDIGLVRAELTWRDAIIAVKKAAPPGQ